MIRSDRAGLLLAGLLLASCTSDEPKKPAAASDAGPPPFVDAGVAPAVIDSGPLPIVDGGVAALMDAGAAAVTTAPDAPRAKASAFDRILAKPKEGSGTPDELIAKVEKATGQQVDSARKTARTWLLFTFSPTSPPRDDAAQRKLIEKLNATGLFQTVEGDRMMKLK